MVELGSKGSRNEIVLAQHTVGQVNGFKVTECGKGNSGSRWGSAEWDFQGLVVGGDTEVMAGSKEVRMC